MKDIFKQAIKENREQKSPIGTWKFLNWLCSKKPILEGENKITPIEETNIKNI